MAHAPVVEQNLLGHPAAMVVVDGGGRIEFWNSAATTLLGYEPQEILGRNFEELLVPPERRNELEDVAGQVTEGGAACFTTERRHKTGDLIPVSVTIDMCPSDAGDNGASYVTLRALSRLKCLCGATVADAPRRPMKELTQRQRQVLRLIAEGRSTREIAQRLALSVKTVETHRGHLMQRLRLKSVAGLVRYAVSIALVPPSPWAVRTTSVTDA